MYKRACLVVVLTISVLIPLNSMDTILKPLSLGCQPLEIFNALWHEYKPYVYTSATILVGGFFVYDFIKKSQRIKKLENDVHEWTQIKGNTALLSEIVRIEGRMDSFENRLKIIDDDLNYLWKFIFSPEKITAYNAIENAGQPFIHRPHIPQYDGFCIRHIIKEICSLTSSEPDNFRIRPIALPSPRRASPLPKSVSPQGASSPSDSSDEEEALNKKLKISKRKNSSGGGKISPTANSPRKKKGDE